MDIIKQIGNSCLLVGVKMRVDLQSGFYFFVSQPLGNKQGRGAQFDQQTGMGMAQIMKPDLTNTGINASLF